MPLTSDPIGGADRCSSARTRGDSAAGDRVALALLRNSRRRRPTDEDPNALFFFIDHLGETPRSGSRTRRRGIRTSKRAFGGACGS